MHLGIFAGKLEYRKAVTDRYSIEIGLGYKFLVWDMDGARNFFKRKGALNGVLRKSSESVCSSPNLWKPEAEHTLVCEHWKFTSSVKCERLPPITKNGPLNLNQSGTADASVSRGLFCVLIRGR